MIREGALRESLEDSELVAAMLAEQVENIGTPQAPVQFKDEGSDLGAPGTVNVLDFVGSSVVATRVGNVVTVTITGGSVADFIDLGDVPASYTGHSLKVVRVNVGETGLEFVTLAGGGDALKADPLSQFAATTSLQLKGVISDETGSGALVFANSPALVTPTGIVKGDVGLGNVDNTSDVNKPVSTAQAAADALKLAIASNLSDLANAATARGNLGGTTVGQAIFVLTNPSAIRFLRINADNSVTARSDSEMRGDLGLGTIVTQDADNVNITGVGEFLNGGLFLRDAGSGRSLRFFSGDMFTVDNKNLTITLNDSNRELVIAGDATVSGVNSGDQASIVGISGTKAQFDTACSDGNFLFTGDAMTFAATRRLAEL